jgi:predicted lipoprotein with Yx(FWY)xxD motif
MKLRIALFALGLLAAATVNAQSGAVKEVNGVLVGANGMTLYTFDKDAGGKSACSGGCATNWPPLIAEGMVSGDYSAIDRDDGKKQIAYKGKPLYSWSKDTKAGDMTGDNVNSVWHVAKP